MNWIYNIVIFTKLFYISAESRHRMKFSRYLLCTFSSAQTYFYEMKRSADLKVRAKLEPINLMKRRQKQYRIIIEILYVR